MRHLRAGAAAFAFLTRIPVARVVVHDINDLAASVTYFPLVGLVVGGIGGTVFAVAHVLWPPAIAVLASMMATVWVTGAFHEDALADSLDGFGGGRDREQVLAIMKDSRVGSYALVGMALVLAAKFVALLAILQKDAAVDVVSGTGSRLSQAWPLISALVVAHVLARWSSVWLLHFQLYVRAAGPLEKPASGNVFMNAVTPVRLLAASIFSVVVAVALYGYAAIPLVGLAFAVAVIAARYFHRRLGGVTGDALGAANQVVELSVYLLLAARPAAMLFP